MRVQKAMREERVQCKPKIRGRPVSTSVGVEYELLSGEPPDNPVDRRRATSGREHGELKTTLEWIAGMAKKTIREAISDVLRTVGQPMNAREIYNAIAAKQLYAFKAKDPASSVRDYLRRHCVNMQRACASGIEYYLMTDDGRFDLLQSLEDLLKDGGSQSIAVFVPSWEGGAVKSGYKVGDYIIWPHPHTDGVWMVRKGGPLVPGKLGRFTTVEAAISWARLHHLGLRRG